ncbi:hypothetical protein N7454_004292 [Penicillium verhagenii]|nr:hypothetical protein N7454_004292 [Penicillium verhagenii]
MSSSTNIGYSSRSNGTCGSTEVECGQTWAPYHACCPSGTYCPSGQSNVICCDSNANCLDYFKDDPKCANSTANLYKANGYFCCAEGLSAFELSNGYVGCTDDISLLGNSVTLLHVSSVGSTSSTATSTSTSATSPVSTIASTTANTTPTSSATTGGDATNNTPSTNTAAIAGGVVGGVAAVAILAGLLWFFLRRRNKQNQVDTSGQVPAYTAIAPAAAIHTRGPAITELDGSRDPGMVELPANAHYK